MKAKIFFRGEAVPEYIERVIPCECDKPSKPFRVPLHFRPLITVALSRGYGWSLYPFFMDKRQCVMYANGGENLRITGAPTFFHGVSGVERAK